MFTGIIEELGKVIKFKPPQLVVEAPWKGMKTGESLAINGVCLTVVNSKKVSGSKSHLAFDVVPETLACSNLGKLKSGSLVNVERPLGAGGRFGGHFVQGHVDGKAGITKVVEFNGSWIFTFKPPKKLLKFIAYKGSVALDGISLTVAKVRRGTFEVAIIPHTMTKTTLGFKKAGNEVNVETDVLAKYVQNILHRT